MNEKPPREEATSEGLEQKETVISLGEQQAI